MHDPGLTLPPIPSRDDLETLAAEADPRAISFTRAGRALQKHGYRPSGSAFPKAVGPPSEYNRIAVSIVSEILNDPETTIQMRFKRRNRQWRVFIEVTALDGKGLGYLWNESTLKFYLDGFREP